MVVDLTVRSVLYREFPHGYIPSSRGTGILFVRARRKSWRGRIAVLALFVISAAGYALAAYAIDTAARSGSALF